jgi:hypothetical protein
MQAVWRLRPPSKRIFTDKAALPRRIPARPQIDLPRAVQFPGEAEGLRCPRRRYTPRIVLHTPHHPTRIIERLPHAAQGIADIPGATQRTQAVVAVHVVGGAVGEYLRQWCGEILRIRGGASAHQHAIAIVAVGCVVLGDQAVQRIGTRYDGDVPVRYGWSRADPRQHGLPCYLHQLRIVT